MSLRPRAGSFASLQSPTADSGSKLAAVGSMVPQHSTSNPFLQVSSITVRISSLVVPEKAHFFVCLQLQKDESILDSNGRIRTEVSSGTRNSVQFKQNTFTFDTTTLSMPRNGPTNSSLPHPPFLHRSGSTLTSPSLALDPLNGLDINVSVYQVFPREDEAQGHTKLSAIGKASLMAILSQLDPSPLPESDTPVTTNQTESGNGRLTRQGSTLSATGLEDDIIENDLIYSIPLVHFYDKEVEQDDADQSSTQTTTIMSEDTEVIEFGTLHISLELRKRRNDTGLRQNIKDLRRPKRIRSDGVRESQTGILVAQHGLSRYYNPAQQESEEFSIRCHGIYNLPTSMRTFLTLKTTDNVKRHERARVATSTTPSTYNYSWSEALVVNVQRNPRNGANDSSPSVGLFLSLVDYLKKTHVAKCIIPVETVLPGEQYNFAIIVNNEGTCIYVSLSLEPSPIFQSNLYSKHPELCCIEVLLHGVQRIRPPSPDLEDPFPSTSYLAVLHFESDFRKYLKQISSENPKLPCQTIRLDNNSAFDQIIPSAYRISPPSHPSLYPQWNCLFELTQSVTDVFAPNAVLIVEIFEINVPREEYGSIDFISWTSIPLAELAQPGMRDGTIARHSSILHMNASYLGANEEPCEMHSGCAPHEFSLLLEMRRWSSRYYLRHKQRSQAGEPNTSHIFNPAPVPLPGSPQPAANNSHSNHVDTHEMEGNDPNYSAGYLPHIRLHNPPPVPPPRLVIDPQYLPKQHSGLPMSMSDPHNMHSFSSSIATASAASIDMSASDSDYSHAQISNGAQGLLTTHGSEPHYQNGTTEVTTLLHNHNAMSMHAMGLNNSSTLSTSDIEDENIDSSELLEEFETNYLETISEQTEPTNEDSILRGRKSGSTTSLGTGGAYTDEIDEIEYQRSSSKSSRHRISLPSDSPSSSRISLDPLRVAIPAAQFGLGAASAGAAPTAGPSFFSTSPLSPVSAPVQFTVPHAPNVNSLVSDPAYLSPSRMPAKRSYVSGQSNMKLSARAVDKRLPELDSVEAERNRRLLELRIAELDLDTAPDCPEKRVLTMIMPQVRQMVMRSTMTMTKANIAEQKVASLQAENLALKRQVQRLLAARAEDVSVPTTVAGTSSSMASAPSAAVTSLSTSPPSTFTSNAASAHSDALVFVPFSKSTPLLISETRASSDTIKRGNFELGVEGTEERSSTPRRRATSVISAVETPDKGVAQEVQRNIPKKPTLGARKQASLTVGPSSRPSTPPVLVHTPSGTTLVSEDMESGSADESMAPEHEDGYETDGTRSGTKSRDSRHRSSSPRGPRLSASPQRPISPGKSDHSATDRSEYLQLMNEVSQMIQSSENATRDQQKTAESIAMRVSDDLMTHFASGIERLKTEMNYFKTSSASSANASNGSGHPHHSSSNSSSTMTSNATGVTNAAIASASSQPPGSMSSAAPQAFISAQVQIEAELRAEIDKLKSELEQYQRKYLLTSAAFGEEILLLRSKLKERKHQLQEARKMQASNHTLSLSHQHSHPRHYIALSPITVPSQPTWLPHTQPSATTVTATPTPSFSLATPSSPAPTNAPNGSIGTLPSPLMIPQPSFVMVDDNVVHTTSTSSLLSSGSHLRTAIKSPRVVDPAHFTFTSPLSSPQLANVPPPLEASNQGTGSGKFTRG